jgi:hypothetical protein
MRLLGLAAAAFSTLVIVSIKDAAARPVTFGDLAGKKVCWQSGTVTTYNNNGTYVKSTGSHGRWSIGGLNNSDYSELRSTVKAGTDTSTASIIGDQVTLTREHSGKFNSLGPVTSYSGHVCA